MSSSSMTYYNDFWEYQYNVCQCVSPYHFLSFVHKLLIIMIYEYSIIDTLICLYGYSIIIVHK